MYKAVKELDTVGVIASDVVKQLRLVLIVIL
jgi:hypothetical protein